MNYECVTIKRQHNNSKYNKKTNARYTLQILPVYMYSRHNSILQTWLTVHVFSHSPEAKQENMAKLTCMGIGGGREGVLSLLPRYFTLVSTRQSGLTASVLQIP